MTSAGLSSSSGAFATPGAGSGYFATAEHYRHLAKAVVDALYRGGLVLVTGDPPVCLPMLTEALGKTAMPRAVIEISCGPSLDCRELPDGDAAGTGAPTPGGAEGKEAESAVRPTPIYVFDDADRLSDAQLEVLLDAARAAPPNPPALEAGVLMAHSSFPYRFERPALHLLEDRLAAHLRLQQLDRDEVETFIRYQLPPGGCSNLFTAQRLALIAITSGGVPAVVNRLARRMLDDDPGAPAGGLLARLPRAWRSGSRKPAREEFTAEHGAIGPPQAGRRRYAASLKLPAIVSLGVLGLIVGALGSRDLDSLLRNHVPLGQDGSVPATGMPVRVALPAAPPIMAAPAAAGSEQSRAALPSPSAPEPTGSPAPQGPRLSANEIAALVARGDVFLGAGDIASARLFFQRAADAGDGRAAMRMAVTFDAAFLDRAGVHGVRSDPEQAAFWYQRARDLGDVKAERGIAPPNEPPSQPR